MVNKLYYHLWISANWDDHLDDANRRAVIALLERNVPMRIHFYVNGELTPELHVPSDDNGGRVFRGPDEIETHFNYSRPVEIWMRD